MENRRVHHLVSFVHNLLNLKVDFPMSKKLIPISNIHDLNIRFTEVLTFSYNAVHIYNIIPDRNF